MGNQLKQDAKEIIRVGFAIGIGIAMAGIGLGIASLSVGIAIEFLRRRFLTA